MVIYYDIVLNPLIGIKLDDWEIRHMRHITPDEYGLARGLRPANFALLF